MKTLNTLQELWEYCQYCPICKAPSREITISAGPDNHFKAHDYKKIDHQLLLDCTYKVFNDRYRVECYRVEYSIDCLTGTATLDVSDTQLQIAGFGNKATKSYFYFYLHGDCKNCEGSYINSSDIEFDPITKTFSGFTVERESFFLTRTKDMFHVSLLHDQKIMEISRCSMDEYGFILDNDRIFESPLISLDFSDYDKIINKIRTLILFS